MIFIDRRSHTQYEPIIYSNLSRDGEKLRIGFGRCAAPENGCEFLR